jgi:hypothetical protein
VEGTNLYWWQYLDSWDLGTSSSFPMLQCGMFLVLAFTVHMIHDIKGHGRITYWSSTEQLHMPLYSDML